MCTHGHSLAPRAAKAKRNPARRPQDAAAELRALLDEIAPAEPAAGGVVINNTVSGGTHHAPVIQVGQLGHGTFGSRG
ncbi:hypothetical protein [Streptomyces albidoflavus]|uniref:hypothetical protein n=1 Tax=Streptomyces albidoflavus TaxID=1886 RepID=UPI00188C3352|nr:hypothetical protein [Streptomyces albidoflavus]MBF4133195.1 hypothetical protein [Streptomyces albidoflavus]